MNHYENSLYPMIPVGSDADMDENGLPFIGCDGRIMVNALFANSIEYGPDGVQYHYNYTDNDLESDLRGLECAVNPEYYRRLEQLDELHAHKDLLSHIGYLVSTGEMTKSDLRDTQNTIHESLKDGHNDYYQWFDLRPFPDSFIRDVGTKNFISICTYLRKTFHVWYVGFQGDRIVIMGHDANAIKDCMAELHSELKYYARGDWVDYTYGTTQRYERFKDRLDTEFDNIHLIAETWGVSEDEAYVRLEKETEKEDKRERELLLFALKYSEI